MSAPHTGGSPEWSFDSAKTVCGLGRLSIYIFFLLQFPVVVNQREHFVKEMK